LAAPELPALPRDLQNCFGHLVDIPDRDLTVQEVEKLWANERIKSARKTRCGQRLLALYEKLRKGWQ
jgi:hypothetical protein